MGSGSTQCSGINKKEITKINDCIKTNKAEPFFKCSAVSSQQVQYPLSKNIWFRHYTVHKTTHQISVLSISNRKPYLTPHKTTDQSKQIHSSSNQLSVASADRNTNQLSPQWSGISCTENPPASRKKQISDTNSLPVDFKSSHSSLNIWLIDNIPQTLRPKNSTQNKKQIKEFSSEQIKIQYSYTLPKGGVAIHKETEKIRDIRERNKEYLSWQLLHKTSHSNQLYKSCHKKHKSFYLNRRY